MSDPSSSDTPLPVKAGTRVPFIPVSAPDVAYEFLVPTLSEREDIYIELKRRGTYLPPLEQTARVLRREIIAHARPDRMEPLIADVDQWIEAMGQADTSAAENAEGVVRLFEKFNDALAEVIPLSESLARMVAASDKYMALLPVVRLQKTLVGVTGLKHDGADVVLERRGGLTTEESLSLIPRDQLLEAMRFAARIVELSPATRKN
jgi:hypothetical protein